MFIVTW